MPAELAQQPAYLPATWTRLAADFTSAASLPLALSLPAASSHLSVVTLPLPFS